MKRVRGWFVGALAILPILGGDLAAEVRDANGKPLADAVVLAVPSDGRRLAFLPIPRQEMDQINQEFVPFVKVVPLGSEVFFPNKDNLRHQVYSFSPAKRFELPLYSGKTAPAVRFDKPGVVVLGCNIHDWMLAYVYVSETPYYGQTGSSGTTTLSGLPEGEYVVRVWHPRLKGAESATHRTIRIPASGSQTVQWSLALLPDTRIKRRSAGAGRDPY